jgi:hemoglobin-like flavoprotein
LAAVYGEASPDHAEELAYHYLRAAAAGRADEAVRYAALAADHAVARDSFQHAASLYRAALDALPLAEARGAAWRPRLLVRLGSALGRDGHVGDAGLAFRDAASAASSSVGGEGTEPLSEPFVREPFVRDVPALRRSFQRIVAGAPQLTTRFYEILFTRHPEFRALFRRNSPPIQAKMMNDTLMAIIDRLEDAPWLRASLAALGARHVAFDVTERMYPLVGECLLATLAEAAGEDVWLPDVAEAWKQAFDAITAMMLAGARAASGRANAPGS